MPVRFGDFQPLCSSTPSYPWCNLLYAQLLRSSPSTLTGLSIPTSSAPVGVNPSCGIPRAGHDGSLGNIANIIVCAVSMVVVIWFIVAASRRKAAVGRIELLIFLTFYLFTLPLQLITTGSFLQQGSTALIVITAIHAGAVAMVFTSLLANAIVATQVVEDATLSSLIPLYGLSFIFFGVTVYIALDVGLGITTLIGGVSSTPEALKNIPLFVLTSIWPLVTALFYFAIMLWIIRRVLYETRPVWFYTLALFLFVLSQLAWFLLGRVICTGSNSKVDGSFVATLLETMSVVALWYGWKSITEDDWDNDPTLSNPIYSGPGRG